jgi:proline iminopeptidase
MFAAVRGTRIYFDVEGMGLVPDGAAMRERPVAVAMGRRGMVSWGMGAV